MPSFEHTQAAEAAYALASVACEITPTSGTGTYVSRVVVRPEKDEVADFPELRSVLGAERPGWHLNFLQSDVTARPVAGDRLTIAAGITYQLRHVESDRLGLRWMCRGFIVEAEDVLPGDLEPQIYMPCGAGFSTAASLLQ